MSSRILAFLTAVLVVACAGPTRGCDLCTTSALVYGAVTNSPGTPVGGISVRAYVGAESCAIRAATEEAGRSAADGAGRFRLQLTSGYAAPRCVQVEASGSGGGTGRTEVPAVRFKPTGSLPYDSVRVDIRVP